MHTKMREFFVFIRAFVANSLKVVTFDTASYARACASQWWLRYHKKKERSSYPKLNRLNSKIALGAKNRLVKGEIREFRCLYSVI